MYNKLVIECFTTQYIKSNVIVRQTDFVTAVIKEVDT